MAEHTPTKARVQAVVDRFRDYAAHRAGAGEAAKVEMGAETIRREGCGTVACHAGHYAAAYITDPREALGARARWRADGLGSLNDTLFDARRGEPFSFECGIRLMMRDLGFHSPLDLTVWADSHPEIWGNAFGGLMFCTSESNVGGDLAFAKDDETAADWCWRHKHGDPVALTLADVIAQWERVRDRLPA